MNKRKRKIILNELCIYPLDIQIVKTFSNQVK